jgi:glycerol uptake facilitator-like aquaporin
MNVRKLSFEFFGTVTLLIAVVGSSFMASYLKADWALGLLINASVTAAVLAIIIKVGAPISGAHFNPVVSLTSWLLKKSTFGQFILYSVAQVVGAVIGVLIANAMFSSDFIGSSSMQRSGTGLFIGEIVATIGLVYLALSSNEKSAWKLIPLWIFAAYFFTSSTSFANPAVTISRVLTEAPAGIELSSVGAFILAQIIGALIALVLWKAEKND